MNRYEINDHGDKYIIEADYALRALIIYIETYHNPDVIEFIADNGEDYLARIGLRKL